jgi:hypothetical protein
MMTLVARDTRIVLRPIAFMLVLGLLVASCGSQQSDETGAVNAETVKQLEDVLRTRAAAMAKGDRDAFLLTIDTTRPAFRRVQLGEFDVPNFRGGLYSTFKLSSVERFSGYTRGFVEEALDGNIFPAVFVEPSYSRRYFRREAGRWILTEPTGDEVGAEKQRTADGVELTYWALDEDVASVYLAELEAARRQALAKSPRPLQIKVRVAFVPTAELAGPGWGREHVSGGGFGSRWLYYPLWYSFDEARTQLTAYARSILLSFALIDLRNTIVPNVGIRLTLTRWLDQGWFEYLSGSEVSLTLRQSCVGIPVLTLKQLAEGPPHAGSAAGSSIAPESFGRHAAYSASMVEYLHEKYGAEAYWRLLASYVQSTSDATNFPTVLGVTPDQFYAAWLVWLKKKYC